MPHANLVDGGSMHILAIVVAFTSLVAGAETRTRGGLEVKNFHSGGSQLQSSVTGSDTMGDAIGYRYAMYPGSSSNLNLGLEAYVGATKLTRLGTTDHLYYGG